MVWAERRDLTEVHLLVEADVGIVARRAGLFSDPPVIWEVDGTGAAPGHRPPRSPPRPPLRPPADLAELLVDADIEVVVEDGIVRGEVLGLEVARIVHGTTTAGTPIDEPVLEVGRRARRPGDDRHAPRQPPARRRSSPASSTSSASTGARAPSGIR